MLLIYYAISNISSTTIVTNTAVHCGLTSKNSSLCGVCTHTLGLSGFSPWTVELCCQWVLPVRPQPWSVEGTRAGRAGEYLEPGTWYRWRWLSPALPTTCMCFTHFTLYLSTTWASSNLDHWHLWDATSRTLQSHSVQHCCLRDLRLLTSPSTPVSVSNLQSIDSHWTHFLDTMKANKNSFCPQCRCTFWRKQTKHHF